DRDEHERRCSVEDVDETSKESSIAELDVKEVRREDQVEQQQTRQREDRPDDPRQPRQITVRGRDGPRRGWAQALPPAINAMMRDSETSGPASSPTFRRSRSATMR